MLSDLIGEVLPDTGQRATDMERIIDRVQTLMSTNFRDIKGAKRLKDKVKGLRTNLRKRITELNQRILAVVEIQDPRGLFWIILFGLFSQGENNPRGRLQVLGSTGVAEVDADYDTSVAKHTEDDDQGERIAMQEIQGSAPRTVSPEPSKRPVVISMPQNETAPPMPPQAITRIQRAVSFRLAGMTDENTPTEGEAAPRARIRDPAGPKPTLRAHEEQYFRLQSQSQMELPLFPEDLAGSGSTEFHTANDQTMRSAVHGDGDTAFTQAFKNLSNNLVIQYNQPSVNEKVPKFDGDYTKWNAFWQAFSCRGHLDVRV